PRARAAGTQVLHRLHQDQDPGLREDPGGGAGQGADALLRGGSVAAVGCPSAVAGGLAGTGRGARAGNADGVGAHEKTPLTRGQSGLSAAFQVPPAGFEPAHTAPEAVALSPELRGRFAVSTVAG